MIIGLRSPLSVDRRTGNALYFRVTNVAQFLPATPWPAGSQMQGITGPQQLNLGGQGVRGIEWCPPLAGGAARYLIIGGPANGGPLEKELFGEKYSLYAWVPRLPSVHQRPRPGGGVRLRAGHEGPDCLALDAGSRF